MTQEPPSREGTIAGITERLTARFPDKPEATVRQFVAEAYDELEGAKVRDFVEVLVEKQAKKRLKHLED
ncbi:MAG: three-helix bundle dimerization domain-containing protein [Microbacterium sp.]